MISTVIIDRRIQVLLIWFLSIGPSREYKVDIYVKVDYFNSHCGRGAGSIAAWWCFAMGVTAYRLAEDQSCDVSFISAVYLLEGGRSPK